MAARPSTPSYRPSSPSAVQRPAYGGSGSGSISRPGAPSYRPPSNGSLVHSGSITPPGGSTIGGVVGPGGGGAIGVKGAGGGTAGAVRGPGGAGAAGIKGPEGGAAGALRGPGGGGAAAARGPNGGTAGAVRGPGGGGVAGAVGPNGGAAGAVRGPGGGGAAGVVGPNGGAAGAVRGPAGGGAAGVRGPGGSAAGAVWGPGGHGVAAARGPYGGRYVTNLPAGAIHGSWHGNDYWHFGFNWYSPCWVGDSLCYGWAYPPVGFYYSSLPEQYSTTVIDNTTYYESEGVYYVEGQQDGQKGYVIAEAPAGTEAAVSGSASDPVAAGTNPFEVLKSMCDQLAGMEAFSAVANTAVDHVGDDGTTVQLSIRRSVSVQRPNKIAIDVSGDSGIKRFVYDGKTASLFDATKSQYVSASVPDTIEAAFDALAQKYNVILPLEDFLYKDLYDRAAARIQAGQYLGLHTVNGTSCHHLAFTCDTADWELWVDVGEKPLPRKVVASYRQNEAFPRYSAEFVGWDGKPAFNAQTFEFNPPASAMGIEISKAD